MLEGFVTFCKDHAVGIIIAIVIGLVIIAAIIVTVVVLKKKKKESFIEHYVGTDAYADQYKYAETYVNSVMGF